MSSYVVTPTPTFDLVLEGPVGHKVVKDRRTGVYGCGADALAALQDFTAAAVETRDVLARQSALTDQLAADLAYLDARL